MLLAFSRACIILSVFLLTCLNAFAQQDIKGAIQGKNGVNLAYANVILKSARDTSFVSGTIANENGIYIFRRVIPGDYLVEISLIGYETLLTPVSVKKDSNQLIDLGIIQLDPGEILDEVEVVAEKQFIEQNIDRMTLNVASSPSFAGGTALDVLESAPGIIVDRQNASLSLAGKDGVQVMINGRIKYVPAAALLQMLQGMSADNIEKIEIITTPPANLDAEGNAGYINLVLKTNLDDGFNGNLSANIGVKRWEIGGFNVNMNYRKGRSNFYGDYSLDYSHHPHYFDFDRENLVDGEINNLSTETDREIISINQSARLGYDYQLSKKTILGLLVSGYKNFYGVDAESDTEFGTNSSVDTFVRMTTDYLSDWSHLSGNLNITHDFNNRQTVSFDLDYLWYQEDAPVDYFLSYYDRKNVFVRENNFRTSKLTPINTFVARTDYGWDITGDLHMDLGAKAVNSTFINELSVENNTGNDWVQDPELSGKYDLDESIFAGYMSFDWEASEKTSYKFGLRYEHTFSVLGSQDERRLIDREYGNLFPSFYVNRILTDEISINGAYSRRIRRQTFNDMAPFVLFMDPFSFWSGNSALQPSISDNVSIGLKVSTVLLMFQYTYEDEAIQRYQGQIDPETNRMTIVTQNMDYQRTFNITLALPLTVTEWWDMQNNFQYNYSDGRILYEGTFFNVKQGSYNINTTQRFKFNKSWSGEIVASYRSAQLRGQFISLPYYGVNAGIQFKLPNDKGILRFNISDMFDTKVFRTRNNLEEEGLVMDGDWDFSVRTVRLTFSRPFGNSNVKNARKRTEVEERRRVE